PENSPSLSLFYKTSRTANAVSLLKKIFVAPFRRLPHPFKGSNSSIHGSSSLAHVPGLIVLVPHRTHSQKRQFGSDRKSVVSEKNTITSIICLWPRALLVGPLEF